MMLKQWLAPTRGPRPTTRPAFEQLENRLVPALVGYELLVDNLYKDMLGRASDDAGRAYYAGRLNSGTAWNSVVGEVMNSQEGYQFRVKGAYQTFLGRAPDQGGLDYWAGFLARGGTFHQMAIQLCTSDEMFNRVGLGNNISYVRALYLNVLGRDVDGGGLQHFTNQLASGKGREAVVTEIFTSPEWSQHWVDTSYVSILHRPADRSGESFWLAMMTAGKNEESVLRGMAISPEYFNNNS